MQQHMASTIGDRLDRLADLGRVGAVASATKRVFTCGWPSFIESFRDRLVDPERQRNAFLRS